MRDEYDFSNARPNPYYKQLMKQGGAYVTVIKHTLEGPVRHTYWSPAPNMPKKPEADVS